MIGDLAKNNSDASEQALRGRARRIVNGFNMNKRRL